MKHLISIVLAISSVAAFAAKPDGAPAVPVNCEAGSLKLATGPEGKGYHKVGSNLKDVGANILGKFGVRHEDEETTNGGPTSSDVATPAGVRRVVKGSTRPNGAQ